MEPLKIDILTRIRKASRIAPVSKADILAGAEDINETNYALKELFAERMIREEVGSGALSLTPSGISALEQANQIAEENAERKRYQRINYKLAIAQIAVSLFTFVLGVIAEHFWGILALLETLFHK